MPIVVTRHMIKSFLRCPEISGSLLAKSRTVAPVTGGSFCAFSMHPPSVEDRILSELESTVARIDAKRKIQGAENKQKMLLNALHKHYDGDTKRGAKHFNNFMQVDIFFFVVVFRIIRASQYETYGAY